MDIIFCRIYTKKLTEHESSPLHVYEADLLIHKREVGYKLSVNTFGDITSHVVIEGVLIVKDYHTFYKFDSTMVFIVDSNGNILPNYLMKEVFF